LCPACIALFGEYRVRHLPPPSDEIKRFVYAMSTGIFWAVLILSFLYTLGQRVIVWIQTPR
jgi:hypothetical protein